MTELLNTIRTEVERLQEMYLVNHDKFKVDDTDLSIFYEGKAKMCGEVLFFLDTLQEQKPKQEVPADTEVLTAKLVNLLKSYRIGEVTATGLANRIADTYGTQRYLDGLCDGKKDEWKPSKEQMDAFKESLMSVAYTENKIILESLYEQLKKLI